MKSGKERGNSARSPFCCPYEHFFKKSISHIFSKTLLNFQVAVITGGVLVPRNMVRLLPASSDYQLHCAVVPS